MQLQRHKRFSWVGLALLAGLAPPLLAGAAEATEVLMDRVLAVVSEDPILASDLEQSIALGLVQRQEGEEEAAFRQRVLDQLIDQKLRFHEIERFGFTDLPVRKVELHLAEIRARFESEAAWDAALDRLGLDENRVRDLVARQLLVLIYIEERLGPRIFVSLDDIRQHYDEVLVPELQRMGETPPEIEAVREPIREVLRQQRLNEELVRWTEELRRQADIVDSRDEEHAELPPIVDRR